jgi:hypothetical protein
MRFQALHSLDAAHAYRLAILRPVSGAFNIAADPVLAPARSASSLEHTRSACRRGRFERRSPPHDACTWCRPAPCWSTWR